MALTVDQITQNIITQLQILDPTVSAEIGTPERKLIEATAEMIASQQVDLTVLDQQHDLASMAGGRLDAYLSIFNFGRQQATPSYGFATFSRSVAALTAILIPQGTQILANINDPIMPNITFVTTQTVILEGGETSVDAPILATVAGTISNVDAGAIVGFGGLRSINGITRVTNKAATTGGQDQESDSTYKVRFQNSFLRNISGTTDMFLALSVALNNVRKANVVGPISRYQEYIQIPDAQDSAQSTQAGSYDTTGAVFPHKRTSAKSSIPYSKYTYPTNYYVTDGSLDPATATFFRPEVDFVFNTPPIKADTGGTQSNDTPTTSPNVTFLNAYDADDNATGDVRLPAGEVVLLEHAYISISSRNDINFGILNCIDVFIDGEHPATVSSTEVVPGSANTLQNTVATRWTYQKLTAPKVVNFRRKIDSAACAIGSLMIPCYWQPTIDLPESIQVGTSTYFKANFWNAGDSTYYNEYDPESQTYLKKAHYIMYEEVNSHYGTVRARNGIEFFQSGNNHLAGQAVGDDVSYSGALIESQAGTEFALENYVYDQNISDLQAILEKNKQTTQDVLVHKGKRRYFRPIVTIMYSLGSTQSIVDASIGAALNTFFTNTYFGSAIQLSDILQVIHSVPGVDNVRWTNDTGSGHKLEEVGADGRTLADGPFWITSDFFIQDDELAASPSANAVTITIRASNTWGT